MSSGPLHIQRITLACDLPYIVLLEALLLHGRLAPSPGDDVVALSCACVHLASHLNECTIKHPYRSLAAATALPVSDDLISRIERACQGVASSWAADRIPSTCLIAGTAAAAPSSRRICVELSTALEALIPPDAPPVDTLDWLPRVATRARLLVVCALQNVREWTSQRLSGEGMLAAAGVAVAAVSVVAAQGDEDAAQRRLRYARRWLIAQRHDVGELRAAMAELQRAATAAAATMQPLTRQE